MAAIYEWMAALLTAWDPNAPADIRAIFTDDAVFRNEPFTTPFGGVDSIVDEWMRRRDESGSYTFEWRPLTVTADIAVVVGETRYPSVPTFSTLVRTTPDDAGSSFSATTTKPCARRRPTPPSASPRTIRTRTRVCGVSKSGAVDGPAEGLRSRPRSSLTRVFCQ